MNRVFLAFFAPLLFFLIKLPGLSLRISDTNIYFYTAYQILQGKILYKDIFFTNFPLFPYLSSVYLLVSKNNPLSYIGSAVIETAAVSLLIFYIVYSKTQSRIISISSQVLYLFSFMILSTSDHQTGVFLASLFSLISYLFFERKKFVISGILAGLMIATKAYFIPIALTMIFYLIFEKKIREMLFLIVGFCTSLLIVNLPFLIFSPGDFIKDVFVYSLTRSQGIPKTGIAQFFITKDFLIFTLLLFNIFYIIRNKFFGLFSVFSILFFLLYQDTYYLYLNYAIPTIAISLYLPINYFKKRLNFNLLVIPTFVFIFSTINIVLYLASYQDLQKASGIENLVNKIKAEKPDFLYGVNDTAPLLAYLSNTRLLGNIIDTNENIFRKKFLNADYLTQKAINSRTILIAHGAEYEEYGINQPILDEIFNKNLVSKKCKLIAGIPVKLEGVANQINLFKCY